jgi:phosphoglycolate phosphatase-like HAD superfamily hydrolase
MLQIMFDIDGTLVQSYEQDEACYVDAVKEVLSIEINQDWESYDNVTDAGILQQVIMEQNLPNHEAIHKKVKSTFIRNIGEAIKQNPIKEVAGASDFLDYLKKQKNVSLSIATGGWYETAVLKLESAGINFDGLPIASSNDAWKRIEIMSIAANKANAETNHSFTYFGDGSWDKRACEQLGYQFILVGNKLHHHYNILDFKLADEIFNLIIKD